VSEQYTLEEALGAAEADVDAALKAVGAVTRELKKAKTAAASGTVRDLRRALDAAAQLVEDAAATVSTGQRGWEFDAGEQKLHFRWSETEGPPVEKPTRRGMGLRVIEGGLMHELGGSSRIEFAPSGVQCAIDIPMTQHGKLS